MTGRVVAVAADRGVTLDALTLSDLTAIEPRITDEVFKVLSVDASVNSRVSYGGTAPENVRKMVTLWRDRLN